MLTESRKSQMRDVRQFDERLQSIIAENPPKGAEMLLNLHQELEHDGARLSSKLKQSPQDGDALEAAYRTICSHAEDAAEIETCSFKFREDVISGFKQAIMARGGIDIFSSDGETEGSQDEFDSLEKAQDVQETALNVTVMRQWFLDHIEHPFPTTKDKQDLAARSNANGVGTKGVLSPAQVSHCVVYFIVTF